MKQRYLLILFFILIVTVTACTCIGEPKNEITNVKIPILLYHDFVTILPADDPDGYNYINTPKSFEENITYLLEKGYTFISIEELNDAIDKKIKLPEKPILISLDDGYNSVYELIYPILKKYNVKASIFIVTGLIGKEQDGKKYLSWNECEEMQNSGLVEVFSHSTRHVFYNRLDVSEIERDVLESYQIIEENLGKQDLKVFAYPYGAYNAKTVQVLKENGIDMQVYDIGMNYLEGFNKDYIKRINISCGVTGKEITQEIEKYER